MAQQWDGIGECRNLAAVAGLAGGFGTLDRGGDVREADDGDQGPDHSVGSAWREHAPVHDAVKD